MPTLDELLAYAPTTPAPTQSGLRRRALLENTGLIQRQQEAQNAAPAVASDPYADNWLAQTGRSQVERLASSVPALGVLGAKLVGADEKAAEWAGKFREMDERATMLGPKVQDFSLDNDLAGNASALGYNLAGLVPDLAMTLTGAGVGAVAGRKVAGGLARRTTRGMLTDITKDARSEAVARAASVAESAARKAPGATPAMVSDTVRVARAAENEGFDDAISRAARVTGLRTPLDKARADRFEKFGSKAGVIAGQFPSLNRENVESLDKDTTDQGDAFATLLGTTGASALGILPVERFLGRFGAEAKAQVAKKAQDFLPRVAKEAATQGLAEGSTEVFQTAAMRATHQYVGENVNLLDADALNEYFGAFLAGGVLGSTVGGGAEAARSVGDFGLGSVKKRIGEWGDMRRAARVEKRKIKAGDEIPLEGAVAKDTVDTFNQHADDLKFDEDLAADATESERRTHERYEAFRKADTNPTIDILQRSPSQLPIKFDTPLKQMLMGAINRDSPIWANRAEANATADALQRLMTGEKLGGDDTLLLVGLSDQMKPGAMSTLFAEADNFAAQVKALDADGLWTKSQLQEAEDDTKYTGAMADAFGEARDKMRTTESEALDARLSGATTITDGPAAEDDAVSQDTYGLNEDKPENRPQVRLFNMTRKDPDFEKVKAEVADNVLKRANNWTPSAYAARVNDPGYVGVRGAPGQLLDLGALASYVRGRDGEQAPLKVAMMAGLAEAIASDVKIDTDTLTPGKITLKNTNEVFELTQGDIEGLKRLRAVKAPTFAERVNKALGVPTAAQRAVQMERNMRLAQTAGVRGAVLTPQDGSGKRTTDPAKLADRTAAQEYDAAELAAFEFARSKGYGSIADWRRAELTERGKNPVTSTRVHRAVANTIKGFAKNMRAGGRTEAQVYEAAEAAADAAAKKAGFSSIAEQVRAKLTERDQEPVTDAAVQLSVDATIEGFVKGIRKKKAEAQTEATSDTRGKRREDEEDFVNTADEAGVALGDVDPRLVARKAPPTTSHGNIRDVRVSDDLADAAQLNEARRPLAALADAVGVDVKSILKISTDLRERRTRAALARKRGDTPIPSDAKRVVPAVITLASGGTINADVPYALLGFNRLLDKKSNTEAPTPRPTVVEEAETEGRAAATDAKVEGAASFDKRRFAGIEKRYGELVEQLDSIRSPAVRARMEKEAADLIVEGRALRAKIAAAENNVRNVERKSFENESTRGSRAAVREAAPRAQTPFEAGVAIGEKRLELQYPGDLFDSRAHNEALKNLRDPKSGKAVEFYERALRGEFGSARVYEQAWDAYGQDNEETAREREFDENAPTPAPKPSADIDTSSAPAFARAKEAAKAKGAKWVLAAEGVAGSFASRIAAQAKALGRLITADTLDSVQPGDVVYMSVPGANRGYEIKGSVYGLLAKILKRGARVRGDNDYHAHRAHNANSEGVIYDALENAGFTRTENSNFAEWSKNTDDDLQNDDSDTDGASSEPFDLDKTQAMVDALLKRMGITEPVKLTTTQFEGGKKTARGTYSRSRGAIFINPKFNAAERFETLTHELGHHVMAVQWDKASPETRKAIEADYKKWLKNNKRSKRAGNATLIYAGRATFLRAQAALAKDAVKPEGSASKPEAVEYAASFDEYVADGIARALNQNADAQSVVDKFFKSIADQLRKLYDAITGAAKGSKWKAPASIDAWVKSLFDANVAAVHQVSGATLPAASAAGAVRAANQIVVGHLNPYVGSSNNYRFVSNEVLAAADNATAEKLRRMIEAHEQKANKYKGATRDSIVFEIEYMKAKLASMSGAAVTAGTASTVPPAGSAPAKKWTRADFNGLMQFMSTVLPPNARLDLERAFNRPVALAQIRKHFAKDPTVLQFLDDSHVGLEATLAAGYLAWQDGALAAGPKGKQAFMDFGDSVAQLFGVSATGDLVERTLSDIADGTVERMRANHDVYSARKGAAADNGKLQKALNWMAEDGPIKRAMSGFWTGIQSRLESTGIPAFRAINAELLLPRGKVSGDPGMIVDIRKQLHRYNRSINNALKDLTDTERNDAVNTLQQAAGKGDAVYDTQPEKVRAAVDGVRAVMQQIAAAASKVDAFGPKFKPPANYFPVVMDIREEGARTKLEALYRKPKFKLHVFLAADYDNKADHTPANFEKAITFLLDAAAGDYESTQGSSSSPTSRSLKRRLSRFVYDHGDANDIREFAALQSKDIDEVFARHLGPMTRMIEFRKRFGAWEYGNDEEQDRFKPRAKLDDLLALAKSQGAKKEDLEYAENAVQAALGNYGTDVSPVLSLLSPDLAKRFSGKKTKRTIQIAQAYQNTRLLPLAILSSLVDPIGIAVRTGGDFKSAWTGMRAGMKALFNKGAGAEGLELLERIGAADEFMPALASHAMFDGPENAWAQRVNRFMFRVNGMSSLVQSTRVMAAYAGEAFLLKHADGAREGDKDSIRYLQELNVSPDDIVEDPNKPGSLVHNADTKEALRRFVDEAILRPNSQQAPLWHRDPFMGLVTQYKGFTYAIYDQITKRMGHELRHGNSWVVLAALAYLPIVLMAELLREYIQYFPDGKPNRKDWGAVDYTMHAAARTGLLGPKADVIGGLRGDIEGNRLPGSSQIGPTASQVSNLVDAFRGYRELDKEVESALPASAAWKHWNDNFGAST